MFISSSNLFFFNGGKKCVCIVKSDSTYLMLNLSCGAYTLRRKRSKLLVLVNPVGMSSN